MILEPDTVIDLFLQPGGFIGEKKISELELYSVPVFQFVFGTRPFSTEEWITLCSLLDLLQSIPMIV
ncbi:hypothetical protein LEP1GSC088_1390 [Leptospira interrogans str. L1207]|nr:hypothetical protein LEP1GSC088_1390 [Leptospira interrogans str. L1207]